VTLVVVAPGSADARSWLSRAARAGGTAAPGCSDQGPQYCHVDMTVAPDLGLSLFRSFAVPCYAPFCSWRVPTPPPGMDLNLVYRNSSGIYLVQQAPSSSGDCLRGWRFTADNTEIELCHETCDSVQGTYGRIDLVLTCAPNGGE
jgi:hypothetical protein